MDQIARATKRPIQGLFRLAVKMATGSGKTTVLAMLIAWQTVNAIHGRTARLFPMPSSSSAPASRSATAFACCCPSDPENYYESRGLVPDDMMARSGPRAIVITNYHAFQHRETLALPKVARSFLQGNDPEPLKTTETDSEMLEAGLWQAAERGVRWIIKNTLNFLRSWKTRGPELRRF